MTAYEKALADQRFQFFLARCIGRPFRTENKEGWIVSGFQFRGVTFFTDVQPRNPNNPGNPNPF